MLFLLDIFITCENQVKGKYFQIWLNDPSKGNYYFSQEGQLPSGAGRITFADMGMFNQRLYLPTKRWTDRDGTLDMIFPSCSSIDAATGVGTNCSINIAYNKQLSLCTSTRSSTQRKCRRPESLCTRDPDFRFDLRGMSNNDVCPHVSSHSSCPLRHIRHL